MSIVMKPPPSIPSPDAPVLPGRLLLLLYLVPCALYARGLSRDLHEPWIGMHDWNGAFFSQLARNLLRYPFDAHGGMPLVAAGPNAPPEERSIYATHPPALVWLVAAAFGFSGESEAVARSVPIAASLASLALLMWLVRAGFDDLTALLTGTLYAAMPMAVYFGRMLDHEAVCLACMLAAATGLSAWLAARRGGAVSRAGFMAAGASLALGVFIDWSVVLFAGLLGAWSVWRRAWLGTARLLSLLAAIAMPVALMLLHLVHAGLGGRWGDLLAIFRSRSAEQAGEALRRDAAAAGGPASYVVENLSWPLVCLSAIGLALSAWRLAARRGSPARPVAVSDARGVQPGPSDGSTACTRTPPAGDGATGRLARAQLCLVAISGAVWLVVFWRQFERHNYWMFYLGPAAAVLAAQAIVRCRAVLCRRRPALASAAAAALLLVTAAAELAGTRDYFSRESRPPAEPRAWSWVREHTTPDQRILLARNPYREEIRGGYVFRNIIPPQMAWYLDRRLAVEHRPARVPEKAGEFAMYVLEARDVEARAAELAPLEALFPQATVVENLLAVIDIRRRPVTP